jgi:AraC-like DNA-binding protein
MATKLLSVPVALSHASADGLSYVDIAMPPDLTLHLDGTDDLSVITLLAGRTRAELGNASERYSAGDVCLGSFPGGDYQLRCVECRAEILTVPAAALGQAAGQLPGQPHSPLRFASLRPASAAAAAQWKSTAAFARGLLDDDQAADSPLVLASAVRLLAATALAVFPGHALTDAARQDRTDARSETLGRAIAFIDDNAHLDVGIADIANAASVTPRAVQLAFRRYLDTTPLMYLRGVRLEHAHQDLLVGDPARETVTAVAYRWGFSTSSRFTAYYRQAHGVPPSQTLQRG